MIGPQGFTIDTVIFTNNQGYYEINGSITYVQNFGGWLPNRIIFSDISHDSLIFDNYRDLPYIDFYGDNPQLTYHYNFSACYKRKEVISGTISHLNGLAFNDLPIEVLHNYNPQIILDTIYTNQDGIFNYPVNVTGCNSFGNNEVYAIIDTPVSFKPIATGFSFTPEINPTYNYAGIPLCSGGFENWDCMALFDSISICMVGVNPDNKNMIVWERPDTDIITDFNIYRETNQTGVYEGLATVPYTNQSVYVDNLSTPDLRSYRYKIGTVTKYGYETPLSEFHKTIHLTINQGVGNSWNLIWTHYEGFEYLTYNIYRGSSPSNLELITTISSSNSSYTDNNATSSSVYYQIEIVLDFNCYPDSLHKMKNQLFSSIRSNIVSNKIFSVESLNQNDLIKIHPNPTKTNITIEIPYINSRLVVMNSIGQIVLERNITDERIDLDVSALSKGVYLVSIENEKNSVIKKFVKE